MSRRWQPIAPPIFRGDVIAFCREVEAKFKAMNSQLENVSREADAATRRQYTIANGVENTTLDVGTSTLAQTQQFIGTLVEDLKSKGRVR